MKHFIRNNGLSLLLVALFGLTWVGQFFSGFYELNDDKAAHGQPVITASEYLVSGHFWQATGENWESEFLQMWLFTVLTVYFYQKGSPESNDPDTSESSGPKTPLGSDAPWPARKGGIIFWLYSHSLSLAFLIFFGVSIAIHALGGLASANEERLLHGEPLESAWHYLTSARFWFESLQNWQSEFLSLAAMVFLSVYLREAGSAESKDVRSSHDAHE